MTRPTARVLALLEILQSGGTPTVPELARRLGVDERTVRRYAAHLIDLEIPVRSVRGRYGGYRLAPGYRLPPLMLTDDEAVAVLLGLQIASRAGLLPGPVSAVDTATAKLRRVLPDVLATRLQALLATVNLAGAVTASNGAGTGLLLLMAEAVRDRRPVEIRYAKTDGTESERTLHPFGIVARSGHWYVSGDDSSTGGTRTFRLDRVSSAQLSTGTFEVPTDFDGVAHLEAGIARAPRRHTVSLRVAGTPEQIGPLFPSGLAAVGDRDEDGWCRVEIRAARLEWLPAVLAGIDLPLVVDGPESLRDLVRGLAVRLATAAGGVNRS